MAYAEIIGDPIAQSKSPIIHGYWLDVLGIEGDYARQRLGGDELADYIASRRGDPDWRGCNVTIPHKQAVMSLLDRIDPAAEAIGAVNCVVPEEGGLTGYNSDIDGVAEALDSTEIEGRKVAVIGAGGGARAVIAYLARRKAEIVVLARNPAKAEDLRSLGELDIVAIGEAGSGLGGVAAIVNATSLGMAGAEPMPEDLLEAVRANSSEALLFDIVTTPPQTEFLACGQRTVDGLTMLIGQARRAFEFFFRAKPPQRDEELRQLLTGASK